ncbi:MAG TPA: S41 family peptidase [Chitinophagales bacterium]|nr:S41 family peptidase [Chitinophagales bacterium]HRK26266.1 S41 family peptidase [Chitinophagales bacterium]
MFNKKRFSAFALLLVLGISANSFILHNNSFEIAKNLELFANIFRELDGYYVDELSAQKLVRSGIDGMMSSLDPYTTFISEEEIGVYDLQTTGKYGGIGATIRKSGDYVQIAEPYEGSPAAKFDLRPGDKILKIDGVSAKGKSTEEVSKQLKGEPNTQVKITIERPGEPKPIEKLLVREEIVIKNVPYYGVLPNTNIGYIKLAGFTEKCSHEVSAALQEMKTTGKIQSLILDLRDNPGGLLNEAIDVANIFVEKDVEIVSTKSRKREWDKSYKTRKQPIDTQLAVVILIDRGSASAAEIVSGAMQDLDRAVVLGTRSFGKGLVQSTKEMPYNTRIKLTTAKYFLPSGRGIQAVDYSGGYSDRLEKVPDSLRTAFKTKNKRTVYDAGGVDPDVKVESPKFANITQSLYEKYLFFDYANLYRNKTNQIPQPTTFELTDPDMEAFFAFLTNKDYDYTSQSEELLTNLKSATEKEKYFASLKTDIAQLESSIKHDKQQDLQKHKPEIKQLLEYEIVSRYFYQRGQIMESLEDDQALSAAIGILQNPTQYNQLLGK